MPDDIRDEIRIDEIHRAVLMVDQHDTEVYLSITSETGGFTFSRYMEIEAAEALVAMLQKGIDAVKANVGRGAQPKTPAAAPAAIEPAPEF